MWTMTTTATGGRGERGTTWLEILIALSIVLPLALLLTSVFRSGAALVSGNANFGANRGALAELAERWQNEAASAWAIFTPPNDVLGAPNCSGGQCHEVDFFARDATGVAHFWAWRYDATTQTLQRYTYSDATAPGATLGASGPPQSGITVFEAHRLAASALTSPALHGYAPKDVAFNFGFPSVDGGNALTVIEVANASAHVVREFLPGTTPSGFDIVVGTFTPPPIPPGRMDPCGITLGTGSLPQPPAPPACTGRCQKCLDVGPMIQILVGNAPCDGKSGSTSYVAYPSFLGVLTYWSADAKAWEFFSDAVTTTSQGSSIVDGCEVYSAATSTTTTYWNGTTS
jgi:hypothetical protein